MDESGIMQEKFLIITNVQKQNTFTYIYGLPSSYKKWFSLNDNSYYYKCKEDIPYKNTRH